MLSEEALQIAVKRREAEGKGQREIYTHLKAEFQGLTRRDKKAFLSNQCKEIEENNSGEELRWRRNRMGRPLSPLQIHQKNI